MLDSRFRWWWVPRLAWALLLVIPIGATAAPSGAPENARPNTDVRVEDGRLSVDLREARLADALRLIAQRGRLPMALRGDLGGRVTAQFTNVPLDEGIARLVRGYSV